MDIVAWNTDVHRGTVSNFLRLPYGALLRGSIVLPSPVFTRWVYQLSHVRTILQARFVATRGVRKSNFD